MATLMPNLKDPMAKSLMTLLASPIHANFKPLTSPKLSLIVNKSAIVCNGWKVSHKELMIGTDECRHNSWICEWTPTAAKIHDVIEEITFAESYSDSLTPNWISSFPKNIGWPPKKAAAPSVEILVLVERLLKIIDTVLPANRAEISGDNFSSLLKSFL